MAVASARRRSDHPSAAAVAEARLLSFKSSPAIIFVRTRRRIPNHHHPTQRSSMIPAAAITPAAAAMQAVITHSDSVATESTTMDPVSSGTISSSRSNLHADIDDVQSSGRSSHNAEIDPQSIQMQIEAVLSAASPSSSVAPIAHPELSAQLSLLLASSLSDLLAIHRRRSQQSQELAESYERARQALDASLRANRMTMDRDWGWNRNQKTREVERKALEIISAATANNPAASSLTSGHDGAAASSSKSSHDRASTEHAAQQMALQIVALLERLDQTQMRQQTNAEESPNPLQLRDVQQTMAVVDPSIGVGAPATAVTTSTIAFTTSSGSSLGGIQACVSGSDATTQTDAFLPGGRISAAEDFDPMASPPTLRAFSPELPVIVVSSGQGSRRSTNVLSWDSSSPSLDRGIDIPSGSNNLSMSPPAATQDHDPLAELAGLSSSPIATVEIRAFAQEINDAIAAATAKTNDADATTSDSATATATAAWQSSGMVHDPLAALAEVSSSPIASVEMRAFAEEIQPHAVSQLQQQQAAKGNMRSRSNSVSSGTSSDKHHSPVSAVTPAAAAPAPAARRSLFGAMYDALRTTSHRLPSPPLDGSKLTTKTIAGGGNTHASPASAAPLLGSKLTNKTSGSGSGGGNGGNGGNAHSSPPMLGRSRRAASVSGMFQSLSPAQQQQQHHHHSQQPESRAKNRAAAPEMASRARRASVPPSSSSAAAAAAAAAAAFSPNAVVAIQTRHASDFGVTYCAEDARINGTSSWFQHDTKVMHDAPTPRAQDAKTTANSPARACDRSGSLTRQASAPSKWWMQRGGETPKMEHSGTLLQDAYTYEKERRIQG